MYDDDHGIRFVRTLFGLARRRATGVLSVACDERKARISFHRGRIVFAEHRSLGGTLGAYLVTRGLMSRATYHRLVELARMDAREDRSPMLRFIEQAVVAGVLDVDRASTIIAGQVERNVVALFAWKTLECRFDTDPRSVEGGPRFPCDLEPLIVQGIRSRFDVPAVRAHLASRRDMYPRLQGEAADVVRAFRFQPAEVLAVRSLDGERTVDELFDDSGLDPVATAHALLALKLAQQIEWSEVRGASGGLVDAMPPQPVPLSAATLADGTRPVSVSHTLPTPPSAAEIEAARAFRRGVAAFRAGQLAEARAHLARATSQIRHPEHVLHAVWVEYELSGCPRDAASFSLLASAARTALEHDPTLAFGYFVVGHLHLMNDDPLNAELAFRRAAKLDPTDARASEQADRLRAARYDDEDA
jgi:hypothetical protein